ncbi:mannitol dehydrogenase family protein [Neorhizobium galegae]|uniref:mannitol dehydrogenase family protein n=1 Tax=Neorhizobium galegae TaxID=399 RepID=UPI0006223992|nr:mannitol dehydrogenase family protein [Neorhizobium galegae]KAB1121108.1 mannitol dehydrogenase family protein [Neorhizobium galegae]MCQ1807487.1 mannitol dehydrogenase family protein [Neorhizobium galegae]CDZ63653.1 Fructuronate reductase [Neorhizobium galegae bv. orientalis]
MPRLSASTALPPHVAAPGFDRALLKPGILHIGLGAFHRAHQAVYTDAALAAEFGDWGIVGVSLRSIDIVQDLVAQDGLYSVVARSAAGDSAQVVGSITKGLSGVEDQAEILALMADPAIRIVTITVTEKAYGIDPVSGGLDRTHPSVKADLADPTSPKGVIGYLVEGLSRRHAAGLPPFTVLCCDNLPTNGRIVRRLVIELAGARDPALANWIAGHGAFPSSMVDRIVPAATDETRELAETLIGAEDRLALGTEPFMQWVIEDHFLAGRPKWEAGGALFVDDVEAYEKMKLRLLNGSHSLVAYLGQLKDLTFVRDVMAVPEYRALVRRHMAEAVKTLDPVPGIDLGGYMDQLIERFENPTIAHKTQQIAMDGTQKLPQRIFAGAVEALANGGEASSAAYVVALWIAYARKTGEINDPRAAELKAAAARMTADDPSAPFFAIPGLFPQALTENSAWRARVNAELEKL